MTTTQPKPMPPAKAVLLAVNALKHLRRARYAAGHVAFVQQGIDFDFAVTGHKKYLEYSAAIETLEKLLTEPAQIRIE